MKPDSRRVTDDLCRAAQTLANIEVLATSALQGVDEGTLLASIIDLAQQAHDDLDLLVRELGDPGIGYRSHLAQRLEEKLTAAAKGKP